MPLSFSYPISFFFLFLSFHFLFVSSFCSYDPFLTSRPPLFFHNILFPFILFPHFHFSPLFPCSLFHFVFLFSYNLVITPNPPLSFVLFSSSLFKVIPCSIQLYPFSIFKLSFPVFFLPGPMHYPHPLSCIIILSLSYCSFVVLSVSLPFLAVFLTLGFHP